MGLRGEVFSWRITSANDRRTYFLNLKENRTGDLYLTVVESKKHGEEDFDRHQVMVFEEDLDSFRVGMEKVFGFIENRKGKPRRKPERKSEPKQKPKPRPKIRIKKREKKDGE